MRGNSRRRPASSRHKPAAAVLFVLWIGGIAVPGHALDVREAVARVLEEDPTILLSGEAVDIAYSAFNRAKADSLPQVSLSSEYSLTYQPDLALLPDRYGSHSISTGLSLSQVLPTSGNLSVILSNAMDVTTARDQDAEYSQTPLLSVTLEQPVFFNGKLIDTSLLPASIQKERIGYLKAEEQNRAARNAAVSGALDLYFSVVALRKQILLAQKTLSLQEENQKRVERNFELGLVSETDVWEARLEVGKQKELLLDSRYGLLQAESALKQSLGMDISEELEPDAGIPDLVFSDSPEELLEKALLANPGLRERTLGLEREKLGLLVSGVNYAPVLTTSLSLVPSYSPARVDSSFGSSFSDFFEEGAGMTYNLSVGVRIPLYNGNKASSEREMGLAAQRTAAVELEQQRVAVFQELQSLLLRAENLKEKTALLADNVALRQRRVEIEKKLQSLGKSTETQVKAAELDSEAKAIELWTAQKELFMNTLKIYALGGEDIGAILSER